MDTSIIIKNSISTFHFVEIFNLKFFKFIEMLKELNSIAEYFLDENGYVLDFKIAKGTDLTFLWKFTVRIECTKSRVGDSDIKSFRLLKLNEFINVYNHIKQHTEALKLFENQHEDHVNGGELPKFSIRDSIFFDAMQNIDESSLKDDDICCICMVEKTNLILSCAHNYCENCIEEWKITSKTCPICRCIVKDNDCFVIAEKPNYFNIQDEISKSLFNITDDPINKLRDDDND
ncbi:unnamed protein product [Brachionus calyciflorus]|uniref:RING finger protein 141 n=1 Tax=Brachionus calyciflorus TaxID=104777 RepID=A0A814G517_9BILA|nr:unnamed protein product [Brachionus calyciflorus]